MNGFIKKIIKGTNKIDIEAVNTLKICNAYKILQCILGKSSSNIKIIENFVKGKKFPKNSLKEEDKDLIMFYSHKQGVQYNCINIYARASINNQVYTSVRYARQKKRDNSHIHWIDENDNDNKFGTIQLFMYHDKKIFALVRELIPCNDENPITNNEIRVQAIHTMVRESHCFHLIAEDDIKGKIVKINKYIYVPDFNGKK